MNGFGFIEYKDPMDARDVVPGMFPPDKTLMIPTLTVNSFPYVPPCCYTQRCPTDPNH